MSAYQRKVVKVADRYVWLEEQKKNEDLLKKLDEDLEKIYKRKRELTGEASEDADDEQEVKVEEVEQHEQEEQADEQEEQEEQEDEEQEDEEQEDEEQEEEQAEEEEEQEDENAEEVCDIEGCDHEDHLQAQQAEQEYLDKRLDIFCPSFFDALKKILGF
jgi:hypothetical protein